MLLVSGPNVSQCAGSSGWRHAEHNVLVCSCSACMCWFRHLTRCSSLSDVGSSISSMLTCTTSPHCALVVSRLLALHSLTEFDSLSLAVSLFIPCFNSLYLSFSPLLLSLRKPKLVQRRRNTCPSAQDITRALQSPSSAPSASAASLDELIQRCLNCFGQSLSLPLCTCSWSLSCVFTLYHNQVI